MEAQLKGLSTFEYTMAFLALVCLAICLVSTAAVSLGGPEENQCVILGLGGHDPLHQQQPALAAWRAQ